MSSTGRSEASLEDGLPVPIEVRPIRSARRMRLRYDEVAGVLKLTCPPRTSRRAALQWAADQGDWIAQQLARARPLEPFAPGAMILIEGAETRLVWSSDEPRAGKLEAGELRMGGPAHGFSRRVETYLKRRALETMSREVAQYAIAAGVEASSVTIGDPATRWGSCSSQRRIRLSWRLIMAPPNVRRYVVAHEVAHLRHLDHSADFKRLEARLFGPGVAEAKAMLKRLGPRLRRLGRRR